MPQTASRTAEDYSISLWGALLEVQGTVSGSLSTVVSRKPFFVSSSWSRSQDFRLTVGLVSSGTFAVTYFFGSRIFLKNYFFSFLLPWIPLWLLSHLHIGTPTSLLIEVSEFGPIRYAHCKSSGTVCMPPISFSFSLLGQSGCHR